jgi:hypothetical protein
MTDGIVEKGPLGLRTGSVRAIIVLALIAFAGIFLYTKGSIPEFIAALVVMAVTFYFKERSDAA